MKLLFISCLLIASTLAQTACTQQQLNIIGACAGFTDQATCDASGVCLWNSPPCPLNFGVMSCNPMVFCTQVMGTNSFTFQADGSCGTAGTVTTADPTANAQSAAAAGALILSATYGIDKCTNIPQNDYNYAWLQANNCPVTGSSSNFVTVATLYNPNMANAAFCNNPNLGMYIDAFALSFNMPVAAESLNANQFLLDRAALEFTLTDGRVVIADCAFMAPDNEADELYTVTLLGDWGDGDAGTYRVQQVDVVNNFFLDGPNGLVNAIGLSITNYVNMDYNDQNRGPHMLKAELGGDVMDANGCVSKYPTSVNVVKVMMDGGSTLDGVTEIHPNMDVPETSIFRFTSAAGGFLETGYLGVADLGDRDNFFDLCLDASFDVSQLSEVYMSCDTALHLPGGRIPCKTQSMTIDIPPPPCVDGTVPVNGQMVPCSTAFQQAAAAGGAQAFCTTPGMSTTCCVTFNANCVGVTQELVEAGQLSFSVNEHGSFNELVVNGLAMIGVLSLIYVAITLGISDFKNDGFTHIPEENVI